MRFLSTVQLYILVFFSIFCSMGIYGDDGAEQKLENAIIKKIEEIKRTGIEGHEYSLLKLFTDLTQLNPIKAALLSSQNRHKVFFNSTPLVYLFVFLAHEANVTYRTLYGEYRRRKNEVNKEKYKKNIIDQIETLKDKAKNISLGVSLEIQQYDPSYGYSLSHLWNQTALFLNIPLNAKIPSSSVSQQEKEFYETREYSSLKELDRRRSYKLGAGSNFFLEAPKGKKYFYLLQKKMHSLKNSLSKEKRRILLFLVSLCGAVLAYKIFHYAFSSPTPFKKVLQQKIIAGVKGDFQSIQDLKKMIYQWFSRMARRS